MILSVLYAVMPAIYKQIRHNITYFEAFKGVLKRLYCLGGNLYQPANKLSVAQCKDVMLYRGKEALCLALCIYKSPRACMRLCDWSSPHASGCRVKFLVFLPE